MSQTSTQDATAEPPTQSASTRPTKAKKNRLSGGFFRFVITRFLLIIPTVFILVTVVFFVMRATGGSDHRGAGRTPQPRGAAAAHP